MSASSMCTVELSLCGQNLYNYQTLHVAVGLLKKSLDISVLSLTLLLGIICESSNRVFLEYKKVGLPGTKILPFNNQPMV